MAERWCPDCGQTVEAGKAACPECGLVLGSEAARQVEQSNAAIHAIRAEMDALQARSERWLAYREEALRGADRSRPGDYAAAPTPEVAAGYAAPESTGRPPVADEPADAEAPRSEDVTPTPQESAPEAPTTPETPPATQAPAPAAPPAPDLAPPSGPIVPTPSAPLVGAYAPQGSVFASPAQGVRPSTPAPAARRARVLTAPVLLGIAGAALLIVSAIVFVAVSWESYAGVARVASLVAFGLAFGALAWLATRYLLSSVGGALGTVSMGTFGAAGFVVIQETAVPQRFEWPTGLLVAAATGAVLARLSTRATELASAILAPLAVPAIALAAFWHLDAGPATLANAIAIGVGGWVLVLARRAMRGRGARGVLFYGGWVLPALTWLVQVLAPPSAESGGWIVAASIVAATALGAHAPRHPWLGATPAVLIVTALVPLTGSQWLEWSGVLTIGVMAIVLLLLAVVLRLVPDRHVWPVAAGLAPAVTVVGGVSLAVLVVAGAWQHFPGDPWLPAIAAAGIAAPSAVAQSRLVAQGFPAALAATLSGGGAVLALAGASVASAISLDVTSEWTTAFVVIGAAAAVLVMAAVERWQPGLAPARSVALYAAAGSVAIAVVVQSVVAVFNEGEWWRVVSAAIGVVGLAAAGVWFRRWILSGAAVAATAAVLAPTFWGPDNLALFVGAVLAAAVVWAAQALPQAHRALAWWSGLLALPAGVIAVLATIWRSLELGTSPEQADWASDGWLLGVVAVAVVAALAFQTMRRALNVPLAGAAIVASGFGTSLLAWIVLAVMALVLVGVTFWRRTGLAASGLVVIVLNTWAIVWATQTAWEVAVTAGLMTVNTTVLALRGWDRAGTVAAQVATPAAVGLAVGAATWSATDIWGASVAAFGAAFIIAAILLWAFGYDHAKTVIPAAGAVSVIAALVTGDWTWAFVALVSGAVAFFVFSWRHGSWARWTGFTYSALAVVCLLVDSSTTASEAYTAVPALALIVSGLASMRRDPTVRSYRALGPGMLVFLVPSYVQLLASPDSFYRPVGLGLLVVAMAAAGVALRWFAPLVATAVTALVIAVSELIADDPLIPRWAAIAFIGLVLLGLAFVAEKIKEMR